MRARAIAAGVLYFFFTSLTACVDKTPPPLWPTPPPPTLAEPLGARPTILKPAVAPAAAPDEPAASPAPAEAPAGDPLGPWQPAPG
jgi:hypothetical protein